MTTTVPGSLGTLRTTYDAPSRNELLKQPRSLSTKITKELARIENEIKIMQYGNIIETVDTMVYASTALALAAWVPTDVAATTGITVTRDTTADYFVTGTSSVRLTNGSAFTGVADVDVVHTLSAVENWESTPFIGFYALPHQAAAAADFTIYVTDYNNVTCYKATPALVSQVMNYVEIERSDLTGYASLDWTKIKSITIRCESAMGNDEYTNFSEILRYAKSNGRGPVLGHTVKCISNSANMARGDFVVMGVTSGSQSAKGVVEQAAKDSVAIFGINCTTDADAGEECEIQIDGPVQLYVDHASALTTPAVGDAVAAYSVRTVYDGEVTTNAPFIYLAPVAGGAGAVDTLIFARLSGTAKATPA